MSIVRFALTILLLLSIQTAQAIEGQPLEASRATPDENSNTLWYDAQLLTLEGQAFRDTKSDYDRLPARAEAIVRSAVWNLSRHSSGLVVPFVTDATEIHVRWTLTSARLAMPHMAATGVSGVDLYVRDTNNQWRWLAVGKPTAKTTTARLISGIPTGTRSYMLYLPLYNGVSSVEIGIPKTNVLAKAPPRPVEKQKPIVFYGTSITQGASATRTGMVHTAILGRRFDRPVINFGFSGKGEMETDVAKFIAEIDAAVFVIDCLPNLNAAEVAERTQPCVKVLRDSHPHTPIVLVEDRSYANSYLVTGSREKNESNRRALRQAFEKLKAAGDENLYYLEGEHLLGDDSEATVDSSHPTDLGFMRQANAFAEVLGPLLNGGKK